MTKILLFNEPGFLGPDFNKDIVGITMGISQERLYSAYMQGIFPWFSEDDGEPVVWYSPEPRFCLRMEHFHAPKSVEKFLRKTPFTYTFDKDFSAVIHGCRKMSRPDQRGTWIGNKMIRAYETFHQNGFAHSVEVWHNGQLAGGFYGVLIGSVFFGESMFTLESNSSKSAFVLFAKTFAKCGGKLIDSQVYTENIARYGALNISRDAFLRLEREYLPKPLEKNLKEEFEKAASQKT
ncbi:MAG: leucyl/phenylalanyl-tRNA--protein transferase [Treponema sp.]|nr:leucyl/phenylalanyl-tRNA--protein transferase [Treponema sp.]